MIAEAEPGAGAVAAICAGLAAALVAMAAEPPPRLARGGGTAAQAEALRQRVASRAGENAGAYQAALGALREAREGSGGGDTALADALDAAAAVPLRVAEDAGAIAGLAAEVARPLHADLRPDAIAAAELAAAAAGAAAAWSRSTSPPGRRTSGPGAPGPAERRPGAAPRALEPGG